MARVDWRDSLRSLGRKLVRILVVLAALALLAGAAGAAWETHEWREFERARHRAPGELVDVGGRRLHVLCTGTGQPGVVLISGLGETFATWGAFREKVARFTRVCVFDRAGVGWSDPADGPRTAEAAARDLAALLAARQPFDGPPILVGHSIGGLYAHRYARDASRGVSGLVLIDPTTEELYGAAADWRSDLVFRFLWPSLGRLGVLRFRFRRAHGELEPDSLDRLAGAVSGYPAARITAREYGGLETTFDGEPQRRGTLHGAVPLVVLSARRASSASAGTGGDDPETMRRVRRASHLRLARESPDGRLIELDSGHYIHHERPDTVVAVIRSMVELTPPAPDSAVETTQQGRTREANEDSDA